MKARGKKRKGRHCWLQKKRKKKENQRQNWKHDRKGFCHCLQIEAWRKGWRWSGFHPQKHFASRAHHCCCLLLCCWKCWESYCCLDDDCDDFHDYFLAAFVVVVGVDGTSRVPWILLLPLLVLHEMMIRMILEMMLRRQKMEMMMTTEVEGDPWRVRVKAVTQGMMKRKE